MIFGGSEGEGHFTKSCKWAFSGLEVRYKRVNIGAYAETLLGAV